MRAVVDLPADDATLAGAAGAVAAAVRDHQIGAHRRGEHRLAVVGGERVIARFYGNLVRHTNQGNARPVRGPSRSKITPSPLPSLAEDEGKWNPALRAARWLAGVIRGLLIGCGDVAMR